MKIFNFYIKFNDFLKNYEMSIKYKKYKIE